MDDLQQVKNLLLLKKLRLMIFQKNCFGEIRNYSCLHFLPVQIEKSSNSILTDWILTFMLCRTVLIKSMKYLQLTNGGQNV